MRFSRMRFSREIIIRYILGSVGGTVLAWAILYNGQLYTWNHTQYPGVLFQFFIFYYISRITWLLLIGLVLGVWGNLIAIRLGLHKEPQPLILAIGATSIVLTSVIITFEQLQFQQASFFFDYFWELALNSAFFVLVVTIPFLFSMLVGTLLLRFTRPTRSISEIIPAEMEAEMRQRKAAR